MFWCWLYAIKYSPWESQGREEGLYYHTQETEPWQGWPQANDPCNIPTSRLLHGAVPIKAAPSATAVLLFTPCTPFLFSFLEPLKITWISMEQNISLANTDTSRNRPESIHRWAETNKRTRFLISKPRPGELHWGPEDCELSLYCGMKTWRNPIVNNLPYDRQCLANTSRNCWCPMPQAL